MTWTNEEARAAGYRMGSKATLAEFMKHSPLSGSEEKFNEAFDEWIDGHYRAIVKHSGDLYHYSLGWIIGATEANGSPEDATSLIRDAEEERAEIQDHFTADSHE